MINGKYIKIKLLIMMTVLLFFIRCTTPVKDYIPGTYFTAWTTAFTEARDTMLIAPPVKNGSGIYQITRRTYMLFQNKPQYKIVHWTGVFNSDNRTITINNNGRILYFDPVSREMNMGTTTYKKL